MNEPIELGRYSVGEIPLAIRHTWADEDGVPLVREGDGWQARGVLTNLAGGDETIDRAVVFDADVDTLTVAWVWADDDLSSPGKWELTLWVGNGENRLASAKFRFVVEPATANITPEI